MRIGRVFLPAPRCCPFQLQVLARNKEASLRLGLALPNEPALQAATSNTPLLAALARLTPVEVHRCCRDLGLVPPQQQQHQGDVEEAEQQQQQQQKGWRGAEIVEEPGFEQKRRAVAEALRSSFLGRAVKQRTEEGARAAVRSAVAAAVPSLAAGGPSSSPSLHPLLGAQALLPRGGGGG